MQLKESVFRCIMQLFDCLLTEVHERCKKGLSLAKRLNSSLAFFCYDLLYIIEPCQVYELVCFFFVSLRLSYVAATICITKLHLSFSGSLLRILFLIEYKHEHGFKNCSLIRVYILSDKFFFLLVG